MRRGGGGSRGGDSVHVVDVAQARGMAVNAADRRPRRRVQHIDLLTDSRALSTARAVRRCGGDKPRLLTAAAEGLLPPWTADVCPDRGWMFHPVVDVDFLAGNEAAGIRWIPNVADDVAVVTGNWLAEHPDPAAARVLLGWLRVSGEPMAAPVQQFMWWCNHYSDPAEEGLPQATMTAARWSVASQWYDMLTDAGIAHNHPHNGTGVAVVAASA